MTDVKYVRNKIEDFKAVTNVQRQVIQQTTSPIVSTWYTSGSVDLNIMISNPAKTTQKVPFKIYLPKEARMEHIMDDGGFNIQYDVQLDTLYASGELELAPGQAVKKFIKMRDIWQISETDLALAQSQADGFYKKLENNSLSAQALLLKNDIDTKVEKILRTQKENTASPQDKIMTYRENKENFAAVQKNLDELKSLLTQADASRGFLGAFGGIQTISVWGIIIAFVTGFGLLVTILFSMWKHQVAIANGQMALQTHILTGQPLDMEKVMAGSRKRRSPKNKKNTSKVLATQAEASSRAKLNISFVAYVRQFFARLFSKTTAHKNWLLVLILALVIAYLLADKYGLLSNISQKLPKLLNRDKISETMNTDSNTSVVEQNPAMVQNNADLSFGQDQNQVATTTLAALPVEIKKYVLIKNTPTGWLNVREQASKESEIVAKVNAGEKYELLDQVPAKSPDKYGWYQLSMPEGQRGWVFAEFAEESQ